MRSKDRKSRRNEKLGKHFNMGSMKEELKKGQKRSIQALIFPSPYD